MSARRSSEHSGGRGKGLQLTFTELLGAHPYLTWVLRRRVLGWPSALCNTWRTHSSCEPQSMVSAQCQVTRAQILCPVRTIGLGVRPARKPLTTWARTLLCLSCLRAPENSLGEWGGWGMRGSSFFLSFLLPRSSSLVATFPWLPWPGYISLLWCMSHYIITSVCISVL